MRDFKTLDRSRPTLCMILRCCHPHLSCASGEKGAWGVATTYVFRARHHQTNQWTADEGEKWDRNYRRWKDSLVSFPWLVKLQRRPSDGWRPCQGFPVSLLRKELGPMACLSKYCLQNWTRIECAYRSCIIFCWKPSWVCMGFASGHSKERWWALHQR